MNVVMHVYRYTTPKGAGGMALHMTTDEWSSFQTGDIYKIGYAARNEWEKYKLKHSHANLAIHFNPRSDVEWMNESAPALCEPLAEYARRQFWETFTETPKTVEKASS